MTTVFSDMPKVQVSSGVASTAQTPVATMKVQEALPPAAAAPAQNDTVELSTSAKKEKKGPIKTIKTLIANVKKFVAKTGEYSKGLVKGVAQGAVAGSLIYTAGQAVKHFKPESKIHNKALAGIVAAGAVAVNLWNASLNATEKSSEIDHRWVGHKK